MTLKYEIYRLIIEKTHRVQIPKTFHFLVIFNLQLIYLLISKLFINWFWDS